MRNIQNMPHIDAIDNVNDKVGHAPQNRNAFMKNGVVLIVQANRSLGDGADVMKSVQAVPLGEVRLPDYASVDPTRRPKQTRYQKWEKRIIGCVVVSPNGRFQQWGYPFVFHIGEISGRRWGRMMYQQDHEQY
jgi:hypothetical protein